MLKPPQASEKARPCEIVDEEPVLGWRPGVGESVPGTEWVLEKALGQGSFGEVWLGRNQTHQTLRVFKFCFRADRVRSLKREATLFRLLRQRIGGHPNIVGIHDVFFDEPPYYVMMDYATGQDLEAWCETQGGIAKVPLETRFEMVAQVAEALQAAHDAGIIHRDVKPSNILIDAGEPAGPSVHVRLTDFGIGQVLLAEYLAGVTQAGFTRTMLADSASSKSGTQLYMAPELLAGKPASTRSDIYSLGVVLFQLTVGDFARPTTTDWALEVTDPLLREDLQHCFAGDPTDRFAAAGQLAATLRNLPLRRSEAARREAEAAEKDRLHQQAERRRRITRISAGFAGGLLLVAIVLAYSLHTTEQARKLQRLNAYASDMKAVQTESARDNRGLAVRLLENYLPQAGEEDLRGVEWRYLWQLTRSDEFRNFPHPNGPVMDVALSPDGRYLATAGFDETIRIWDIPTGSIVKQFLGGGTISPKKSLAFAPDGSWMAMRGKDGIEFRETTGWTVTRRFEGINAGSPIALSADGNVLAGITGNGQSGRPWPEGFQLAAWSLEDGNYRNLSNAMAIGFSLAVDSTGSRLAYSRAMPLFGGRAPIRIWEREFDIFHELARDEDATSLAISQDDQWLVSGHWGGDVCYWSLDTGKPAGQFRAHHGYIYGLAFSPDSRLLATGGSDQLIHLWQAGTSNRVRTLHGHQSEIYGLVFSANGQRLASASQDGTAKLWNTRPESMRTYSFRLPFDVTPIGFLSDGSALLTVGTNSRVAQTWNLPTGEFVKFLTWTDTESQPINSVRYFPKNGCAMGISNHGAIHLRSLGEKTNSFSVTSGEDWFSKDHLSPDQHWIVGRKPDPRPTISRLVLWNLREKRRVPEFGFLIQLTYGASFSTDGKYLAFSSYDSEKLKHQVALWDLTQHRLQKVLGKAESPIGVVSFSPDNTLVACGGWDDDIRLWDVRTGNLLWQVQAHIPGVGRLVFSVDGKTLVSEGGDQAIRFWNVATGREMLLFQDAIMPVGPRQGWITDSHAAGQAEIFPGNRWLVWQDLAETIHVIALPSLAEIDSGYQKENPK